MPIPQSSLFPVCDWNARAAFTSGEPNDRSIVDPVDGLKNYLTKQDPGFLVDTSQVFLVSDASKVVGAKTVKNEVLLPLNVGGSFTFEFDIDLTEDLPKHFGLPDNRLYVGISGAQGRGTGLLFSYQGVAACDGPEDLYPEVLGGSDKYLFSQTGDPFRMLTVRVVVDSLTETTAIYLAPTATAYDATTGGSQWAVQPDLSQIYSLSNRTIQQEFVGVRLHASAMSQEKLASLSLSAPQGQSTVFGVSSLRVANTVLVPTPRPVAVVTAAPQIQLGSNVVFNGGGSFDLSGLGSLSFVWEIESAPDGSAAVLTGSQRAGLTIGGVFRVVHRRPTSAANSYVVAITAHTDKTKHTTATFFGKTLSITLAVIPGPNGQLTPNVTVSALFDLFNNPLAPGYVKSVADKFLIEVLNPDALVPTGTFNFSSGTLGAGSTDISPSLNPDVPGFYGVSLVVSNGVRPSLKVETAVLVSLTEQLFRHRPNTEYIFDHLSDFWNLVPDKEQITTIWSAMSQAISADVVSAWQADHYKAHKDVSRLYQRRWLPYSTSRVPDQAPEIVMTDFVGAMKPGASTYQTLTLQPGSAGLLATKSANLTGLKTKVAPAQVGGKVLYRSSLGRPKVVTVASITNVAGTDDEWDVSLTSTAMDLYKVLVDNNTGFFTKDESKNVQPVPMTTRWFSNRAYSLNQVNTALDRVRLFEVDGTTTDYLISTVNPLNNQGLPSTNVVRLNTPAEREVDGRLYRWQHLRGAYGHYFAFTPYLKFPAPINLTQYELELGDYVDFTLTEPLSGVEFSGSVTVLAADDSSVFVQWDSLFSLMSSLYVQAGGGQKTWKFSELSQWQPTFTGFRKSTKIKGDDLLVSVPILGTPLEAQLYEGTDYYVKDGSILVKDWVVGELKTTANSASVTFTTNAIYHAEFQENSLPIEELISLKATTLVIEGGDAGSYQIVSTDQNGTYTLDRALHVSGNFLARIPRFHHSSPSAASLWGEVSYFSNHELIEGNFGLYVGLPKALLDQHAPDADYLSVVRSMWFALLNGPTLHNLKLPIQSLISLPYAEAHGQIVQIVPPTAVEDGKIVLVSYPESNTYVYRYPLGADLATNPSTGRVIKAYGSLVPPANQAEQDLYDDSIVPQFSQLVTAVSVEDYVSDPALNEQFFQGQDVIRRYHTFVVTVPLDLTNTTGAFPLIKQFLSLAKPAHTNFILLGKFGLADDVVVDDVLDVATTISLKDGPAFAPFNAHKIADAEFPNNLLVPLEKENKLWPVGGAESAFSNFTTKKNLIPAWSAQAYAAGAEVIHNNRTWEARVGGAQAADVPGVSNVWASSLKVGDVKERYESGYVEGVLDNYSGDGSYNFRNKAVDMINRVDHNDVDVCRSKMWLPIRKTVDGLNFQVGEKLQLRNLANNPSTEIETLWKESPPVIEYISTGEDPKFPGVTFLQHDHPYSYLWLGFDYIANVSHNSYGHEDRLRAPAQALQIAGNLSNVQVKGLTSGATAVLLEAPTIDNLNTYGKYFHLERMFRLDKVDDYGPEDTCNMTVVARLPFSGTAIGAFQAATSTFTEARLYRALQTRPYSNAIIDDSQFVPSVGPGCYTQWPAPANPNVNWGYSFSQDLLAIQGGVPIGTFPQTINPTLENVYFGLTVASRPGLQFSQGFTSFKVPTPVIRRIRSFVGGGPNTLRVEGHFFVDIETIANQPVIPATPTTYGGNIGGAWFFYRPANSPNPYDYNTWVSAPSVQFLTGYQAGETVLWKDASPPPNPLPQPPPPPTQSRTGHVFSVGLPALPDGTYDVILRQYRRYGALNLQLVHYDEAIAPAALVVAGVPTSTYAVPEYPGQGPNDA